MSAHNHVTVRPTNFQLTERQVAEKIGREYHEWEVFGGAPLEVREASAMVARTNEYLFDRISGEGVEVIFTPEDPYGGFEEMKQDIFENRRLKIFAGGSHPEWSTVDDNLTNRAVHDYWGHFKNDVDFSFWGEFQKWHHMKRWFAAPTHNYLFAEVVGQTGLCWYLNGGFDDPDFVQKPIMAPERWIDLCYENFPGDFN